MLAVVGGVFIECLETNRHLVSVQPAQLMRPSSDSPSGWQWITTVMGVFSKRAEVGEGSRPMDGAPPVTRIKFAGDKKPSNLAIVLIGFSGKWHWCLRIQPWSNLRRRQCNSIPINSLHSSWTSAGNRPIY